MPQWVFTGVLAAGTSAYLCWEARRRFVLVDTSTTELHTQGGPSSGVWGLHTAPIDWCEQNYAVTTFITEFWNTVSCIFYVVAALAAGVNVCFNHALPLAKTPRLYQVYWIALLLTGIWSAVFHATLWWWGQKLDELWENITLLALVYMGFEQNMGVAFIHGILCSAGVVLIPEVFTELHVAASVAALLHVSYRIAKSHKVLQPLVSRAAIHGVAGFSCWLVDKTACGVFFRVLQLLQLHAWWHLFTALALYQAGVVALCVSCLNHGIAFECEPQARAGTLYLVPPRKAE